MYDIGSVCIKSPYTAGVLQFHGVMLRGCLNVSSLELNLESDADINHRVNEYDRLLTDNTF